MPRHCIACGAPLAGFDDRGRQRERCTRCGRVAYRNSKPCVGAIVRRGAEVLLSRRAVEPHRGLWDLPGGFLESGEHPEAGVVREIHEETGLVSRVVRLVAVEVGRYGEDDTLNFVYELVVEGEPSAMDDSLEMRWFPLDGLPPLAFPHEERALRASR